MSEMVIGEKHLSDEVTHRTVAGIMSAGHGGVVGSMSVFPRMVSLSFRSRKTMDAFPTPSSLVSPLVTVTSLPSGRLYAKIRHDGFLTIYLPKLSPQLFRATGTNDVDSVLESYATPGQLTCGGGWEQWNGQLALAIQPLFDLLTRYAPTPSHLTTIHPVFLRMCVSTRHFAAALPVLAHPISTIDTSISDLTYNDNLVYHYAGGVVYAALKRWPEAQEFFEICACSPGSAAAAIQMEALKKLIIVQLIHEGKTTPPPKYIHPVLPQLLKGTPYSAFVNAYPDRRRELREIVDGELVFTTGLVLQALERAPRWLIKRLTSTYLTLHLSDIANAVGIESVDEVRALIVDMRYLRSCPRMGQSHSLIRVSFEKADVDRVLAQAQEQATRLATLEREMARSKEYLIKAMKGKEEASWGAMDDDLGDRLGPGLAWADDIGFPLLLHWDRVKTFLFVVDALQST
ncbi:hypothetical protein V8E55_007349 [Tylopilus felleus]